MNKVYKVLEPLLVQSEIIMSAKTESKLHKILETEKTARLSVTPCCGKAMAASQITHPGQHPFEQASVKPACCLSHLAAHACPSAAKHRARTERSGTLLGAAFQLAAHNVQPCFPALALSCWGRSGPKSINISNKKKKQNIPADPPRRFLRGSGECGRPGWPALPSPVPQSTPGHGRAARAPGWGPAGPCPTGALTRRLLSPPPQAGRVPKHCMSFEKGRNDDQ